MDGSHTIEVNGPDEIANEEDGVIDLDNPQFESQQNFRLNRWSLSFRDQQVEKNFWEFLGSRDSVVKTLAFGIIFLAALSVSAHGDSVNSSQYYRSDRVWISVVMHYVLISLASLLVSLLSLSLWPSLAERLKPVTRRNQQLFFMLLLLSSIFFSLLFFAYNLNTRGTPWAPHATLFFALFMLPHISWWAQLASTVFQITLFGLCAGLSGYPESLIAEPVLYLCAFGAIGVLGVVCSEHSSKKGFARQEMSLMMAQKNARALCKLAEQARSSDEAKSRFIANISHEIRTPLHGVITALDLLKMSGSMTPEQDDYIQVAATSSGLLLDILNSVLTISKLQAKMVALEQKPLDMRSIVENVAVVFSQIAARKGVEVAAFIPPSCPVHLISDSVHLKQILFNLVSNAVKFTEKGGVQIHVLANEETETEVSLTIQVQDTGIGVAQEHLHLLFQRFSQVDESSTRKFQGTGLGLALVFEFSKLFDGTIRAFSDGPEKGSTFAFSAKFRKDPNYIAPPPFSTKTFADPYTHWVSLVLPELPTVGEMCGMYLSHMGFECSIGSTKMPPSLMSSLVKDRLGATAARMTSELRGSPHASFCVPCCVIIDHSLVNNSQVLQTIHHLEEATMEVSLSFQRHDLPSFPACPLLVVVLEPPGVLGETTYPSLYGKHVWSLKKPCRLEKLQELVAEMHSFLNASMQRARSIAWRRASTPEAFVKQAGSSSPVNRLRLSEPGQEGQRRGSITTQSRWKSALNYWNTRRRSWASGVVQTSLGVAQQKQSEVPIHESFFNIHESTLVSTPRSFVTFQELSSFRFGGGDGSGGGTYDQFSNDTSTPATSRRSSVNVASENISSALPNSAIEISEGRLLQSYIADQLVSPSSFSTSPSSMALDVKHRGSTSHVRDKEDMAQCVEPHKRVLVADDNAINRKLTQRLLHKAGFECTCVEDGSLAVAAAARDKFAVVFMDITMPVMDGCRATSLIQEHQRINNVTPRTLICALSAAESECFQSADFDAVLPKPVKVDDLIEVANRLSNQWLSERQAS